MAAPKKYSQELRDRATRMALDARRDPVTATGAIKRIADQLGIHPEALRTWVRQAEIEAVAESLPGGGRWVVLLPLEAIGGQFTGQAVAANARDGEVIRQWRYDARSGLVNMAPDG